MNKKTIFAVAIAVAFLAMPVTVADHETEDRSASYINQSGVDHGLNPTWHQTCTDVTGDEEGCPVPIPSGIMSTSCDDNPGWTWVNEPQPEPGNLPEDSPIGSGETIAATPWHGIGGVLFCNVEKLSDIAVEVDEAFSPIPLAAVTCMFEDAEEVTWFRSVEDPDPANADPEYSGSLPDWCVSLEADAGAASVPQDCVRAVGFNVPTTCEPATEFDDEDDGPWNYCDDSIEAPEDSVWDGENSEVYCEHPFWEDNTRVGIFNRGPPDGVKTMGTTTLEIG